jgi:hypothetical protein
VAPANLSYREQEGDVEWIMREALRRAGSRDQGVATRAVLLVDVLNLLKDAIGLPPEANGIFAAHRLRVRRRAVPPSQRRRPVMSASLAFDERRTGTFASDHFGLSVEVRWPTRP